jgi:hypothetical protein
MILTCKRVSPFFKASEGLAKAEENNFFKEFKSPFLTAT